MATLHHARVMLAGESYWRVRFQNNKELCELDRLSVPVLREGREHYLIRRVEWLEDLVGSGDIGKVKEVMLVAPGGVAAIPVPEPYTAFQLSQGVTAFLTGERIKCMQMVGVVVDRESGECEYALWDVQMQRFYHGRSSIHAFGAWRVGVTALGALACDVMGIRL